MVTRRIRKQKKNRTKYTKTFIVWRFMKVIVFICCLSIFFYQSAEFLQVYYKYPTTTKIKFTYPEEFQLPAFTFCKADVIKRSKLCAEYPSLCKSPENITSFCEEYPFECKDNTSNPVIPNYEDVPIGLPIFPNELLEAIEKVYFSGNITIEFWEEWTWSIKQLMNVFDSIKPVFVADPDCPEFYLPCYSLNLLLDRPDDPETLFKGSRYQDMDGEKSKVYDYEINVRHSDLFFYMDEPTVFFSIHSPFVPVNPRIHGWTLKPGFQYNIFIRLEEEHLLPYPYETDCTDYRDLWMKNNKKGPRSQEMCEELCLHDLYQTNKNMSKQDYEFTLLDYPLERCIKCNKTSPEEREFLQRCTGHCKKACRNLKYTSNVIQTALVDSKKDIHKEDSEIDLIKVEIFLPGRQVIVERHVPEYVTGDLYSYIGGLMGCWLGVSIFAFAGIAENVFRRLLHWMKQMKRYYKETSPTPITAFSTRYWDL